MTPPVHAADDVEIRPGPALLRDAGDPVRDLVDHRRRYGAPTVLDLATLVELTEAIGLRGRGGAGFPFATKLRTVAEHSRPTRGRRPILVVNAAEGEPASAKDAALARTNPHLALDGATVVARALGAREIHVVVPGDRPTARTALEVAVAQRRGRGLRWHIHVAAPRFVSGQSRAVLELIAGRPGLPVTGWEPEAVSGHQGRPTLLSNLETWAYVGLLALQGSAPTVERGTEQEPGTVLLTVHRPGRPASVVEAAYGDRLSDVLELEHPAGARTPVLLGGFHGTWAPDLSEVRLSPTALAAQGLTLGAGLVVVPERCPLELTADIVAYLALESAGRCGPCINGLPALARALGGLVGGDGAALDEVQRICAVVAGRGACAHPDGTARLTESVLVAVPDEVAAHLSGVCHGAGEISVPVPRMAEQSWAGAR